jgi:hypothetical protein
MPGGTDEVNEEEITPQPESKPKFKMAASFVPTSKPFVPSETYTPF